MGSFSSMGLASPDRSAVARIALALRFLARFLAPLLFLLQLAAQVVDAAVLLVHQRAGFLHRTFAAGQLAVARALAQIQRAGYLDHAVGAHTHQSLHAYSFL